tara:strand:- start:54 stop:1097 length:1044 start_codon:yes stop_codon:yes gene_type:complete
MNDTKTGFNGIGVINLNDYGNLVPRDQNNATYLHIEWLDLSTVDLTDEEYFNTAIRSEGAEDFRNRVDSISLSYKQNGFSTRYWPPCFGTDGKPRDGRGRITAAIENGERFIPVAVYMYDDDSIRNTITNGIIANQHDPASRPGMEDFINAGVQLIANGELDNFKSEVTHWLYKEAKVESFIKKEGGHITKIINAIMKRGENGGNPIVKSMDSEICHKWIAKNLKLKNRKDYILSSVDNVSYMNRTWCEGILPLILKSKTPIDLILYTAAKDEQSARDNMKKFVKTIDKHYESSFKMINESINGITLSIPAKKDRPYRFLGALPQIVGKHYILGGSEVKELICIEDY